MKPDQFNDIEYRVDASGVAWLIFNTPKRKNALSMVSFFEVFSAVEAFKQDDSAMALVVTGAHDSDIEDLSKQAFCSGGYFSPDAMQGVAPEILAQIDISDIAQKRTTLAFFTCDKPIIAAVNGLAIGGGVTLALAAADYIVMANTAWMRLPFAKLGISTELASSFLLPRAIGLQKAKELMFFAERIDAQRALKLGLVNQLVEHADLLHVAEQKARELIPPKGSLQSIKAMKKMIHAPLIQQVSDALDRENEALATMFHSDDFKQALQARVAGKAPEFTR